MVTTLFIISIPSIIKIGVDFNFELLPDWTILLEIDVLDI